MVLSLPFRPMDRCLYEENIESINANLDYLLACTKVVNQSGEDCNAQLQAILQQWELQKQDRDIHWKLQKEKIQTFCNQFEELQQLDLILIHIWRLFRCDSRIINDEVLINIHRLFEEDSSVVAGKEVQFSIGDFNVKNKLEKNDALQVFDKMPARIWCFGSKKLVLWKHGIEVFSTTITFFSNSCMHISIFCYDLGLRYYGLAAWRTGIGTSFKKLKLLMSRESFTKEIMYCDIVVGERFLGLELELVWDMGMKKVVTHVASLDNSKLLLFWISEIITKATLQSVGCGSGIYNQFMLLEIEEGSDAIVTTTKIKMVYGILTTSCFNNHNSSWYLWVIFYVCLDIQNYGLVCSSFGLLVYTWWSIFELLWIDEFIVVKVDFHQATNGSPTSDLENSKPQDRSREAKRKKMHLQRYQYKQDVKELQKKLQEEIDLHLALVSVVEDDKHKTCYLRLKFEVFDKRASKINKYQGVRQIKLFVLSKMQGSFEVSESRGFMIVFDLGGIVEGGGLRFKTTMILLVIHGVVHYCVDVGISVEFVQQLEMQKRYRKLYVMRVDSDYKWHKLLAILPAIYMNYHSDGSYESKKNMTLLTQSLIDLLNYFFHANSRVLWYAWYEVANCQKKHMCPFLFEVAKVRPLYENNMEETVVWKLWDPGIMCYAAIVNRPSRRLDHNKKDLYRVSIVDIGSYESFLHNNHVLMMVLGTTALRKFMETLIASVMILDCVKRGQWASTNMEDSKEKETIPSNLIAAKTVEGMKWAVKPHKNHLCLLKCICVLILPLFPWDPGILSHYIPTLRTSLISRGWQWNDNKEAQAQCLNNFSTRPKPCLSQISLYKKANSLNRKIQKQCRVVECCGLFLLPPLALFL